MERLTIANSSPFTSSPLAATPTFPSPTITTTFYKPQEVSRSPLLTPPSKKGTTHLPTYNSDTHPFFIAAARTRPLPRARPLLPPPTPQSVPSSCVKIDQKMTALTNISPTLLRYFPIILHVAYRTYPQRVVSTARSSLRRRSPLPSCSRA